MSINSSNLSPQKSLEHSDSKRWITLTPDIRDEVRSKIHGFLSIHPAFEASNCPKISTVSKKMGLSPDRLNSIMNPRETKKPQRIAERDLEIIRSFSQADFLRIKFFSSYDIHQLPSVDKKLPVDKQQWISLSPQLRQDITLGVITLQKNMQLQVGALNQRIGLTRGKLGKISFSEEDPAKHIKKEELEKIQLFFQENLSENILNTLKTLFPGDSRLYDSSSTHLSSNQKKTLFSSHQELNSSPSSSVEPVRKKRNVHPPQDLIDPFLYPSHLLFANKTPQSNLSSLEENPTSSSLSQVLALDPFSESDKNNRSYQDFQSLLRRKVEESIDANITRFEEGSQLILNFEAKRQQLQTRVSPSIEAPISSFSQTLALGPLLESDKNTSRYQSFQSLLRQGVEESIDANITRFEEGSQLILNFEQELKDNSRT